MDSVLGLSITPTAVGLVVVEGALADGEIVDREAIEVPADGTASATRAADQVAAAVARTKAIDASYVLHGIGLTWSDDAGAEASLLLETLAEQGFDNVVPMRLPQASEAFAQGIGTVLGYSRTAVCVVQSDGAIASLVDSRTSEMRASASDEVSHDALHDWLADVMVLESWRPEALVMVGTGTDLAALSEDLEAALDIPVFAPGEAELALARGAALACVRSHDVDVVDLDEDGWEQPSQAQRPKRSGLALAGMGALAAGAVTFVVSLAVAAGMQLTPDRDVQETANRTVDTADEVRESQITAAAAPAPELPEALPSIPEVAPAPVEPVVEIPEVLPEPEVAAPEPVFIPEEPVIPVVEAPAPVYVPEAPVAPPVVAAPPAAVPTVPAVEEPQGFLDRIRDRISSIGDDPAPPVPVAPAPVVPPPAP